MHSMKIPTPYRLDTLVPSFRACRLLLLLALVIHEAGCGRSSQSALQESLRRVFGTTQIPGFVLLGEAETAPWKETQAFYRQRDFHPAWIQDGWLGGQSIHPQ